MAERHIVAMGGGALSPASAPLERFILDLARSDAPKVLFVPTASGDDPGYVVRFYEALARESRARSSHLPFYPWPPPALRELVLGQDVVYVGGGNTANMLAIWRVHGLDGILREAWEQGVVLCGSSAGMICWFEAGVTDSFGPELAAMRDGLGLLRGSACPHYDGEERRRPLYQRAVAEGFPGGYAAEDSVGLHFAGGELAEVVSARAGARAFRVELSDGEVVETPLPARVLP